MARKNRRLRRYSFGLDAFCEMFKQDTEISGVRISHGWPKDAIIVGLHSDEKTYSFTVIVQSKEFDLIKISDLIPEDTITLERMSDEK